MRSDMTSIHYGCRVNAAFGQALRRAKVPRGEANALGAAAADAVQAASDAAHGRWIKLLTARWVIGR